MQTERLSSRGECLAGKLGRWTAALACGALLASPLAQALEPTQRDQVRFRLENLFNEVDLVIRNRPADLHDLKRQERTFAALNVFERIPLEADWGGLKRSLSDSAAKRKIRVLSIMPESPPPRPAPLPARLDSDDRQFRLRPEQVAEALPFRMSLQGDEGEIRGWLDQLREKHPRLVELRPAPLRVKSQAKFKSRKIEIRAQAFRFRPVRFPKLEPRDPLQLLPANAQRRPTEFSKQEPTLWNLVTRTQARLPQARPLYRDREKFLLNAARMDFFIQKSARPPASADPLRPAAGAS